VTKKALRVCPNGHRYYKSSDCLTCPVCEKNKPADGFLSLLAAPARRALKNNGITTPEQLAEYSENEILLWHGIGPAALVALRAALKAKGHSFKRQ
jgi:predicted RecB family nuclease